MLNEKFGLSDSHISSLIRLTLIPSLNLNSEFQLRFPHLFEYYLTIKNRKKSAVFYFANDDLGLPCFGIKKIVISSPGGILTWAYVLASVIYEHKLEVEISENGICLSACTDLALFTDTFKAHPKSVFMFHDPLKENGKEKQEDKSLPAVKLSYDLSNLFDPLIRTGIDRYNSFYMLGEDLEKIDYPLILITNP